MNTKPKQDQCNVYERRGQLVLALNCEKMIPENAPVRLVSAVLEELDYERLYRAYSPRGRKSAADPQVLFEVMVYGYLCGIYSSRKLEEACRYRVDFMWLLGDEKAPDHSTLARFRTGRCREALEGLFYQLVKRLEAMGETDHRTVFVDGTKLESRAGRYTFVWRKSVEKHLAKVKEQVRKATGLTSPAALQSHLESLAKEICFVHGKGKRKSLKQKDWERLSGLLERWEGYETQLSTMGEGRNSYAKTDEDATFMRMKEDHMRNGQLKPGYNVQIAVNSEYITGIEAFSDRNDVRTLRPFLRRLEKFQQARYEEVVADAGYESLDNYLYLDSTGQTCLIKPANYDQKKRKKFQKQIGRIENMAYDPEEDCFTCAQAESFRCVGNTQKKKTAGLSLRPGTGVKTAPAAPAAVCAAEPRTQSSRNSCVCKRLFGRSVRKPLSASLPSGASICACAAPSRWRGHLLCSKTTLASADSSPAAGPTSEPSCSCWPWLLI